MNIVLDSIIIYGIEVFWALLPLFISFIVFQYTSFKLSSDRFWAIIKGIILSFLGLVLFLYGVKLGFIDTGVIIGEKLGLLKHNWILAPVGFILGFVVTLAEPAIQILIEEIEKISAGYINKKILLYFLSFGVALSVSLSMIRLLTGISLWFFLLPGYIIVLILIKYVSPMFVAIAFDSGGIVTGPMIATFLLSLNVGVSKTIETSNTLIDTFGMIAMVSLVPIISVLILGLLYERSTHKEVVKNDFK